MRFSLIMTTIERAQEFSSFLAKSDSQMYRDFELIIVDQNSDKRLVEILKPCQTSFPIINFHSIKNVSVVRDVAINASLQDIIQVWEGAI